MLTCAVYSSLFFKKEMELSLIGLHNAGKTSLVNVIATGGFQEDMIPTVGFNMRKVSKGAVTIKLWDLGGQVITSFGPPALCFGLAVKQYTDFFVLCSRVSGACGSGIAVECKQSCSFLTLRTRIR